MTYGIYRIINKRTGESYIGQSQDIEKRFERHVNELKNNSHKNTGIQKDYDNGDSFLFMVLKEINPNKKELDELEVNYIIQYNTFYEGYNQTPGGPYDQYKGEIDYGGGRLPISKYKEIKEIKNLLNKKQNDSNNNTSKNTIPPEKLLKKANVFIERKEWKNALKYYENYLNIEYDYLADFNKSRCLYELKEYEKSIENLEKIIKKYKNCSNAWKLKALNLIKLDLIKKAYDCIINAKKINPNDEEVIQIKKELESNPKLEKNILISQLYQQTNNTQIINEILEQIESGKILSKTEIDAEIRKKRRN